MRDSADVHKIITGTQLVELLQLGTDLRDHINDQLENIPSSGSMENGDIAYSHLWSRKAGRSQLGKWVRALWK